MRYSFEFLLFILFLGFVSCKSNQKIVEVEYTEPDCQSEVECISLATRAENCEAALLYMQSIFTFGTLEKLSDNQFELEFNLKGIDNALLTDSRLLQFHLHPQCFNGLGYKELFALSLEDEALVDRALKKQKKIAVELSNNNSAIVTLEISRSKHIDQSKWSDSVSLSSSQDTLTNYYLETLGETRVTIDYTRAITGPSRKTISTKNNRLLIVTSLNGDTNVLGLRSLSRCYFNPEHFVGLGINEFLAVFDIERLDQASIALISNIVVNIQGHSQLIMAVEEGKIIEFRYN